MSRIMSALLKPIYRSLEVDFNIFNFDALTAPPIRSIFSEDTIEYIRKIAMGRVVVNHAKRIKLITEVMKKHGFSYTGTGTNRLCYTPLFDDRFVVKLALDSTARSNNIDEKIAQQYLKPFVTKIFEVTQDGIIAFAEKVVPFTDIEEFRSNSDRIYSILKWIPKTNHLFDDCGTNSWKNWGFRNGFGPVLLDFPEMYRVTNADLYCTGIAPGHFADEPDAPICDGELDYDEGMNFIRCKRCGAVYMASELTTGKSDGDEVIENLRIITGGSRDTMSKLKVVLIENGKVYNGGIEKDTIQKPDRVNDTVKRGKQLRVRFVTKDDKIKTEEKPKQAAPEERPKLWNDGDENPLNISLLARIGDRTKYMPIETVEKDANFGPTRAKFFFEILNEIVSAHKRNEISFVKGHDSGKLTVLYSNTIKYGNNTEAYVSVLSNGDVYISINDIDGSTEPSYILVKMFDIFKAINPNTKATPEEAQVEAEVEEETEEEEPTPEEAQDVEEDSDESTEEVQVEETEDATLIRRQVPYNQVSKYDESTEEESTPEEAQDVEEDSDSSTSTVTTKDMINKFKMFCLEQVDRSESDYTETFYGPSTGHVITLIHGVNIDAYDHGDFINLWNDFNVDGTYSDMSANDVIDKLSNSDLEAQYRDLIINETEEEEPEDDEMNIIADAQVDKTNDRYAKKMMYKQQRQYDDDDMSDY